MPTLQSMPPRRRNLSTGRVAIIAALAIAISAWPAPPGPGGRAIAREIAPAGLQSPVWTLERILETARSASPRAEAARAEGRAGEAMGATHWGALSPRITATGGLTRSNDPALLFSQRLWQGRFTADDFALDALNEPGPRTALEYGLVLEQPLWNGAAEITAPAAARRARREARAAADAAVADLLLDAVRRYVDYVAARAGANADSLAMAAATAEHEAAVERHRRGQVPDLDTLRTFAHAAEAHEQWLSRVRDRDVARRRLGDVIGAAPSDAEIAQPAPEDPASFLRAGDAARAGDAGDGDGGGEPHELRAARARADRLGLEASRAAWRLLPSLNARFAVTYYRDPEVDDVERRWYAGLSVDWPLWDGTVRLHERKAASARAEAARAEAEASRRDLEARADAARRDVDLSGPRRDAARAARDASEEALRLATARYRAGLLSLDALLAVDAEAARARKRHIERDADVLLAGYTYLHAIGRLR